MTPEEIERLLAQHHERLKGLDRDLRVQVANLHTILSTERRLAEDRHETKMLRFDKLDAAVDELKASIDFLVRRAVNGTEHA